MSDLDLGIVRNCDLAMLVGGNCDLEDPKGVLLHWMRVAVPTIYTASARSHDGRTRGVAAPTEVSDKKGLLGVGSPLPVDNIVVLVNVEAECVSSLERCSQ